jgi:hypothetical protein
VRIYTTTSKDHYRAKGSKSCNLQETPRKHPEMLSQSSALLTVCRWTAICRGAVIKAMTLGGLERPGGVTVTTRVSKRNYGVSYYTDFREGYHVEEDRQWIQNEGAYMADNQMRWYLRRVSSFAEWTQVNEALNAHRASTPRAKLQSG